MISPARFDDLTPGREHSFMFDDPVDVLIARSPDEVIEVLHRVEAASRSDLWAAGFLSYEAAPAFDPALTVRSPDRDGFDVPLAWFGVYRSRRSVPALTTDAHYEVGPWEPTMTEAQYTDAVDRIRSRIAAGDTYQVNLSFRLRAEMTGDIDGFYFDLIRGQRGGYGARIDTGDFSILSASPELFYKTEGSHLEARPMKGTISRGRWAAEDVARRAALMDSAKDEAENLMIVDLLRNDIGRIAQFGTVEVPELFIAERYETLWQLTSTITAEVQDSVGVTDIMKALFPSGSITGAPKASTMAIIADAETTRRGVYCGAIGFVEPGGDSHFNVAIRTVVVDRGTGRAQYGTGGGITWDSTPQSEFAEAGVKAELLAIQRPDFGLFETLRCDGGEYLFLDEHIRRLGDSAEYFGFDFNPDLVRDRLHAGVPTEGSIRVRCTLWRDGTTDVEHTGSLDQPFVAGPNDPNIGVPVRLAVAGTPIDANDPMLYHKTTWRDRYDTALADAPSGADDVVLINQSGEVTETTIANLAIRIGDQWTTPPLDSGCLPGVLRSHLLRTGHLVERSVGLDDLRAADGIAVINSVRGWRLAELADWR